MQLSPIFDKLVKSLILTELHQHVDIVSVFEEMFEVHDILVIKLLVNLYFLT